MKAITLYQPHATLMAIGAKKVETRPRRWKHRGPVAIHAGANTGWLHLCTKEPFRSVLAAAGFRSPADLPLGKVVALVDMYACLSTDSLTFTGGSIEDQEGVEMLKRTGTMPVFDCNEFAFGNYSAGRFGYLTRNPRLLLDPIPYSGHQGYWNLPVEYCDTCDGVGLMEGWNRRDGHPCPKCHGNAVTVSR